MDADKHTEAKGERREKQLAENRGVVITERDGE